MTTRRMATLGLVPAILLGAIVAPIVLYWGELPDSIAIHWDVSGEPNGKAPPVVLLVGMAGIYAAVWHAVWRVTRRAPREAPSFAAGLFGIGGLLATVQWIIVLANRNVADWDQAGEFELAHLVLAIAVTLALGLAGWLIAGGRSVSAVPVTRPAPRLELEPGQTAVWSGAGRGWVLIATGLVLVAVGIAVWSWAGVALVVVGLLVLAFAEVRATAGPGGVTISMGWLGIPSWTIPLQQITGAEIEDVAPMAYGGWGYRIRPGVRAVVVRGGEGLRILRRDKADLVVTVNGAATGAGLVNALLVKR